ncbi:MAG: hypothetical protein K2Q24_09155 [Chitinophagaceae bacterium]|nr:hypothetical protein [Chitinophagaceae bacterium]
MLTIFFLTLVLYSCKKNELEKQQLNPASVNPAAEIQKILESDFFVQNRKIADMATERNTNTSSIEMLSANAGNPSDPEYTDEVPMLLGMQLPNPYSIPNMVETYNIYYSVNLVTLPVTHYYVRFSPTNETQLTLLEDSLEVEIFDYPMDYEVLQDGDFYQQPGKGTEDMPDFFAVVPNNFQFPTGVPYVILEDLHFPHDDPVLEALAESIAAGAQYSSYRINNTEPAIMMTRIENNSQLVNQNNCECFPNPENLDCIPPDPDCIIPPPPPPPGGWQPPTPGPAPANTPSGYIRYQDNVANIDRPLRGVEVIAKRGRKTARAYTDNNGFFVMGRNFPGPVKIIIKYRTSSTVNVKPLRLQSRIRLSLLTVRQRYGGTYGVGVMNQLNIRVSENSNINSRGHMYWLASHALDARYQQELIASTLREVKHFSGHRLVVYLSRWGIKLGREPMTDLTLSNYIAKNRSGVDYLIITGKIAMYAAMQKVGSLAATLLGLVFDGQKPDIIYNYNTNWVNQRSNITHQKLFEVYLECGVLKGTTNELKWKHYFKAKEKWIDLGSGLINAEGMYNLNEYLKKEKLPENSAFTDWTTYTTIATNLGLSLYYSLTAPERSFFHITKGFSIYYSHILCDRWYIGTNNSVKDQYGNWVNSSNSNTGHQIFLENWRPNVQVDLFKYERVGIFNDLNDANSDPVFGSFNPVVFDQVQGTKISDMFKSITAPDGIPPYTATETWPEFKSKILYYNPSYATQINQLFSAYQVQ